MKRQKGFTLLETLVVLGIASFMLVSIFMWSQHAKLGSSVNDASQTLVGIKSCIQNTFDQGSEISDVNDDFLAKSECVPSQTKRDGEVVLSSTYPLHVQVNNKLIHLTVSETGSDYCQALTKQLKSNFDEIKIGGDLVKERNKLLSVAKLQEACKGNADNEVDLAFRR